MAVDVPATIWQPTDGNTEFNNIGQFFIVDSSVVYLVDPSGNFIVDTGVQAIPIPSTVWQEIDNV